MEVTKDFEEVNQDLGYLRVRRYTSDEMHHNISTDVSTEDVVVARKMLGEDTRISDGY